MLNFTVVVPTYRRPDELKRCLDGIDRQELPPFDVVVAVRDTDEESRSAVREWMARPAPAGCRKKTVAVRAPGVLAAMRAATEAAEGDVVAYTDDDAVPRPSWLRRLAVHYRDPGVAGAGGRDAQPGIGQRDAEVGRLTWYGKLIGNHHVGMGPPREVDVLKGVNLSLRREFAAFPDGLLGQGAQVHFEVHVCLRLRRLGFKLMYDPDAVVDHYPAARFDLDRRNAFVAEAVRQAAYNFQSAVLTWGFPLQKVCRLVYAAAVGDRAFPGLVRAAAAVLRGEREVARAFVPGQTGQWQSLWRLCRGGAPKTPENAAGAGGNHA